jgi:[acyl-carrier-protein] S-malonyltransferase
MGRDLLAQFPKSRLTFEEAEDAAKIPIRKLCIDGPEDHLRLTENTQPAILAVSVAIWRSLVAETGLEPALFAGHSLGEYSALVASGKLDFGRAAFLVRARGLAMQAAVPDGMGAMAAILNIPGDKLAPLCIEVIKNLNSTGKQAKDADGKKVATVLEIVNFNSPTQLVVAGHRFAVEGLVEIVGAHKGKGVMLPVSAPFHSTLMEPAKVDMTPLLQETSFTQTPGGIIANFDGEIPARYSWELLAKQISSPVLWYQTIEKATHYGCKTFIEVGPGKVLSGLAKRLVPKDSEIFNTEDLPNLVGLLTRS